MNLRYLLATGALPPEVAAAFASAIANQPAYRAGSVESGGYSGSQPSLATAEAAGALFAARIAFTTAWS